MRSQGYNSHRLQSVSKVLRRMLWLVGFVGYACWVLAESNGPQMFAHCINVGQADATLLEFPCGAVLIDAGAQDDESATHLVRYLAAFFARRPDLSNTLAAIYITHPHKDHTFALKRVVQNFATRSFIENGQEYGSGIANVRWLRGVAKEQHIVVRQIINSEVMKENNHAGLTDDTIDPIKCTNCDPHIVIFSGQWDKDPGWSKEEYRNNNNHSLVIRIDFGESSFMFGGDLEEDAINSLLSYYQQGGDSPDVFDVDVYHVGHHGSNNGTTKEWLDALTPILAVISVGQWDNGKDSKSPFTTWAYGHPRKVTIDLLGTAIQETRKQPIQVNAGTASKRFFPIVVRKAVYATAWDGDVTIRASLHHEFEVLTGN